MLNMSGMLVVHIVHIVVVYCDLEGVKICGTTSNVGYSWSCCGQKT